MPRMNCPLCDYSDCMNILSAIINISVYECNNCGDFTLTAQAKSEIRDSGWKLAAYVFEQNRRGISPTFYRAQKSVPADALAGVVGIDTAIEAFPKSVAERLDRALLNVAAVSEYLGKPIRVNSVPPINPLLLAQNIEESFFILQQFALDGYITGNSTGLPTNIKLTLKAFNRVSDLQRGLFGPFSKQVFVAMSFDKDLDEAWGEGLKPGIEDCGFDALRVDKKHHNEKICDVIIAEIRKSKFLVADFTKHRNGVYFEAGMMMGLGRPVIYTCRKDYLNTAHFDTRQYNHIEWETSEELREKLKQRIQATIV